MARSLLKQPENTYGCRLKKSRTSMFSMSIGESSRWILIQRRLSFPRLMDEARV